MRGVVPIPKLCVVKKVEHIWEFALGSVPRDIEFRSNFVPFLWIPFIGLIYSLFGHAVTLPFHSNVAFLIPLPSSYDY